MKKYIRLSVITAVLLALALVLPTLVMNFVPGVGATRLAQTKYSNSVLASGTVEEKEKKEVTIAVPVVPESVNVSVGDEVNIGDVLATVNKEQTVQAMASTQSSLASSAGEFSALLAGSSFDTKVDDIPEQIIATSAGVVTSVSLEEGSLAMAGTPAITISDLGNLQAKVSVTENNIGQIQVGQSAKISGAALGDQKYDAVVSKIYPTAKKQINGMASETVVDVLLDIKDGSAGLTSGFTVTAEIETGEMAQIFVLPYECVAQDDEGNEFVYLFQNGKAVKRIVETGIETAQGIEIVGGGITNEDYVIFPASSVAGDQSYVKIQTGKTL